MPANWLNWSIGIMFAFAALKGATYLQEILLEILTK